MYLVGGIPWGLVRVKMKAKGLVLYLFLIGFSQDSGEYPPNTYPSFDCMIVNVGPLLSHRV